MEEEADLGGCLTAVVGLVVLVPLLLGCALVGSWSWWHERDLRDLPALARARAEVVDVDQGHRWWRDRYEVRFRSAQGEDVRREVPVQTAQDSVREVEVAYAGGRPERVRTVEDWQPLYAQSALVAACGAAALPLLVLWEATRRLRRRVVGRA